jgi:hypothetical protein
MTKLPDFPLIIKTCACGAEYSLPRWKKLKLVGYHADDVERLELRNCTCGSTIAITVDWKKGRT